MWTEARTWCTNISRPLEPWALRCLVSCRFVTDGRKYLCFTFILKSWTFGDVTTESVFPPGSFFSCFLTLLSYIVFWKKVVRVQTRDTVCMRNEQSFICAEVEFHSCVDFQIYWPAARENVDRCILTGKSLEVRGSDRFCCPRSHIENTKTFKPNVLFTDWLCKLRASASALQQHSCLCLWHWRLPSSVHLPAHRPRAGERSSARFIQILQSMIRELQ